MNRARLIPGVVIFALLFMSSGATAEKWTKGRMSLFIFARTVEPSTPERAALSQKAKDELDVAENQLKGTEQDLKKRHGGKRDQWPPEARATFDQANEARRLALYRWLDLGQTQQALDEWTQVFRDVILGKKVEHTAAATSPEDADLTVEVVRGPSKAHNVLFLRVAPGRRLDASKLGGMSFTWRSANVTEVHAFTPAEPTWEIEATGAGNFGPHQYASSGVGGFIREYFDVIASARRQP